MPTWETCYLLEESGRGGLDFPQCYFCDLKQRVQVDIRSKSLCSKCDLNWICTYSRGRIDNSILENSWRLRDGTVSEEGRGFTVVYIIEYTLQSFHFLQGNWSFPSGDQLQYWEISKPQLAIGNSTGKYRTSHHISPTRGSQLYLGFKILLICYFFRETGWLRHDSKAEVSY